MARRTRPSHRLSGPASAYQAIRELIVRGRMPPGLRLVEAQIVQRLGASRSSVRSALQRLQQEGYVTEAAAVAGATRPRPAVAPLTGDDARELFHMVAEIEGLAAERAAELPESDRAALVAELTQVNDRYRKAASAVRPEGDCLFTLDTRFHRLYVEAGSGARLLALHDSIKPQLERYVRTYQTVLTDAIQTSLVEHAAIVAEIATGSGRGAHEAVRTNWRNAAVRLRAVIGSRGEAGTW